MAKKIQNDPSTEAETAEKLVTVRVHSQPICEDGIHYRKGEEFLTTATRAAALVTLLETVPTVDTPEA